MTLAKVLANDYPPGCFEVIVVEDGAGDESRDIVLGFQDQGAPVTYLAQPNSGVAAARNRGARVARGDVLIFLDDDMLVEPSHIRDHLATRELCGDCLINGHWEFSPQLLAALNRTPFGRFRLATEDWVKTAITKEPLEAGLAAPSGITAANLSIRRDLFWELGGFDEDFPMAGCEDQDFSHRAAAAGCRFVYDPAIRLWHDDNRVTLRQFCARQEQGAITAMFLAAKHGGAIAKRPLISENTPITRGDGPTVGLKKLLKRVLSVGPVLATGHRAIEFAERRWPESPILPRVYWGMCGLYIFRGIRSGLKAVRATNGGSRSRPGAPTCRA